MSLRTFGSFSIELNIFMNWSSITSLHLEISSLCNAVCPQCARYPTASHYVHPNISHDHVWSIDSVRKRLPLEDLVNIKRYLLNGTVGDFITNKDALEIVKHFKQASSDSVILINTNGSARSTTWWQQLAKIPNVTVNFAIDGLEDTHHLYRRNTNWQQIIANAKSYIQAGGTAEWTMTIFKHNQHQVESCKQLANELGFNKFYARHSDRTIVPARNKTGTFTHWLEPADGTPVTGVSTVELHKLERMEINFKNRVEPKTQSIHNNIPLPSLNNCDSLRDKSIYIGGNWSVAPCCFLGILSFTKQYDHRYDNFYAALTEAGLTMDSLLASDSFSVKDIINRGFDWIYDRITTDKALTGCVYHCHPDKSNFRISRANLITHNKVL